MNQTRKIKISQKVFTLQDLEKIAAILDKQASLAKRSNHHASSEYSMTFADETTHQSDSPDLFSDQSPLVPSRPVAVKMTFRNYTLHRYISISLCHGDSSYFNVAEISGDENDWVAENFLKLKEAFESIRPQVLWLRKHETLLLCLIATGIGSLVMILSDLFADVMLARIDLSKVVKPAPQNSPWRDIVQGIWPYMYVLKLTWYWLIGFLFGAFEVRRWLFAMWPEIEFDFGLPHLKVEHIKRRRLVAVWTLIVVPILCSVIYEAMKSLF